MDTLKTIGLGILTAIAVMLVGSSCYALITTTGVVVAGVLEYLAKILGMLIMTVYNPETLSIKDVLHIFITTSVSWALPDIIVLSAKMVGWICGGLVAARIWMIYHDRNGRGGRRMLWFGVAGMVGLAPIAFIQLWYAVNPVDPYAGSLLNGAPPEWDYDSITFVVMGVMASSFGGIIHELPEG